MTDSEIRQTVGYYQRLLHLTQWKIAIGICDRQDYEEIKSAGSIAFSPASLDATMVISTKEKWDNGMVNNQEESIVHELLHLQFSLFEPEEGTPEYMIWHQTIELMARVIVGLAGRTADQATNP